MIDPKRRAFLESILETPDDDTPRLIYADWLTDHDDPRGEFIRIQCELAQMREWDRRRPLLEWQQRDLLDQNESRWRAELPKVKGIRWGDFRRGFVDVIHLHHVSDGYLLQDVTQQHLVPSSCLVLDSNSFVSGKTISRFDTLREVRIEEAYKLDHWVGTQCSTAVFEQLHVLELAQIGVDSAHIAFLLSQLPLHNLQALYLDDNRVGPRLWELLDSSSFAALRTLSISDWASWSWDVEDIDLALDPESVEMLSQLPLFGRLRSLHLAARCLGNEGMRKLLSNPHPSSLEVLDLRGNSIGPLVDLDMPPTLLRPKFIDLSQNEFGSDTQSTLWPTELWQSEFLESVESLAVSDCELTPSSLSELCTSSLPLRVQSLKLSGNPLREEGTTLLTESSWPALHTLDLTDCPLGSRGLSSLAGWQALGQLVVLSVGDDESGQNQFSGEFGHLSMTNLIDLRVRSISLCESDLPLFRSETFPELRSLALSFSNSREVLEDLPSNMSLPELRFLDLHGNSLGDSWVKRLFTDAQLPKLTRLDLASNNMTALGVNALVASPLAERLRSLKLSWNTLGSEGGRIITGAESLSPLVELIMDNCDVRTDGLVPLLDPDCLPNIIRLHVAGWHDPEGESEADIQLRDRFDYQHGNELPRVVSF